MINFKDARQETISYHEKYYSQHKLFEEGSWLAQPDAASVDIAKQLLQNKKNLHILDIGCGVGRNAIALARLLSHTQSLVRCVDMLPLALEKLKEYAGLFGVENIIEAALVDMDELHIEPERYDLILAISCLEHSKDLATLWHTLTAVQNGTAGGGYNRLWFSTDRQVVEADSGLPVATAVETPLDGGLLLEGLNRHYSTWTDLRVETSLYSELLEYKGRPVRWSSKEVSLIARKPD